MKWIIGAVVVGVLVTAIGVWANWMAGNETSSWERTCARLSADVVDGPQGRRCVRGDEVVYP